MLLCTLGPQVKEKERNSKEPPWMKKKKTGDGAGGKKRETIYN
jgi:hypothetical protein